MMKKKLKLIKKKKAKGLSAEALAESRKIKSEFLLELGTKKVPTSILIHDRFEVITKTTDTSRKNRGGGYAFHYKKNQRKLYSNKNFTPGLEKSGLKLQGRTNTLSAFPQNIGRIITRIYCPENGTVYDPFCIVENTMISLPEGDFPIKELVGKKCYVYCSDGKEIRLRKAYNIRKTRCKVKVLKITFRNGKSIEVTPNHLIMTTSGKWIKAEDLTMRQSIMPFRRNMSHGRWVVKLSSGNQKRQSRFIYEEIHNIKINTKKHCIHHKDFDKTNDTPSNFELLTLSRHSKVHHPKGIAPYTPTKKSRKNLSIAITGKGNHFYGKNHSEETKKKIGEKAKNRNVGRTHGAETRKEMSKKRRNKEYIPRVQELLRKGNLTHKAIAKIVGVHKNTVGNIAQNRFQYNHMVSSIEEVPLRKDVYNMEVEEFNNFAANGVIVHNCGHNSRMELCYKSGMNYIGVDICHEFMADNKKMQKTLLKRNKESLIPTNNWIDLIEGSSHDVSLPNSHADFTITSPPYWNIEYYGPEEKQLGKANTYRKFIHNLLPHVRENYRILKQGAFCCWFINDFRKNGVFYPYHIDLYGLFIKAGFTPFNTYIVDLGNPVNAAFVQDIINNKILPKKHEYILVFRKD